MIQFYRVDTPPKQAQQLISMKEVSLSSGPSNGNQGRLLGRLFLGENDVFGRV
jgi:hypothetical protein